MSSSLESQHTIIAALQARNVLPTPVDSIPRDGQELLR